jgi:hypothetical protein
MTLIRKEIMEQETVVKLIMEVGQEYAADLRSEDKHIVAGLTDCLITAVRRVPQGATVPERKPASSPTPRDSEVEGATDSVVARMGRIFRACVSLYRERTTERGDVWRRSGVRGQTFHVYAKAERAFMQVMRGELPNPDHFVDLINYATFALILITEFEDRGEDELGQAPALNGEWPWA